jgi:hypothetical protein
MTLLEKLWKETYKYTSDKPIGELRSDIQALLQRTRGWSFETNLVGSFYYIGIRLPKIAIRDRFVRTFQLALLPDANP